MWEDHVRYGFTVEEWTASAATELAVRLALRSQRPARSGLAGEAEGLGPGLALGGAPLPHLELPVTEGAAALGLQLARDLGIAVMRSASTPLPGSWTSSGSSPALTWSATSCSSTWMRCRSPWAWARSSSVRRQRHLGGAVSLAHSATSSLRRRALRLWWCELLPVRVTSTRPLGAAGRAQRRFGDAGLDRRQTLGEPRLAGAPELRLELAGHRRGVVGDVGHVA